MEDHRCLLPGARDDYVRAVVVPTSRAMALASRTSVTGTRGVAPAVRTDGGGRRPLRQTVPAIGRGRRQNPSDRASAQASRPPSHPSRSHWTPHRAREVAVVARKSAPQGRPMPTATHRHESITAGRTSTALATSTALTRVDDTLLRASPFRLTTRPLPAAAPCTSTT